MTSVHTILPGVTRRKAGSLGQPVGGESVEGHPELGEGRSALHRVQLTPLRPDCKGPHLIPRDMAANRPDSMRQVLPPWRNRCLCRTMPKKGQVMSAPSLCRRRRESSAGRPRRRDGVTGPGAAHPRLSSGVLVAQLGVRENARQGPRSCEQAGDRRNDETESVQLRGPQEGCLPALDHVGDPYGVLDLFREERRRETWVIVGIPEDEASA